MNQQTSTDQAHLHASPMSIQGVTEQGNKELWNVGETGYFEYHGHRGHDSCGCEAWCDPEAWYRSHQTVAIIDLPDSDGLSWLNERMAGYAERQMDGCFLVYTVQFEDGHQHDVFEDEMYVSQDHLHPGFGAGTRPAEIVL